MNKLTTLVIIGLCLLSGWHGAFAAPILLKTGEIDPSSARPKLMAMASQPVPERGLYLIQHDGVTPPEWRAQVAATGAILRDYMPENAWIVEASSEAYAKLCEIPHSYLGEYKGAYRIEPGAKEAVQPGPRLMAEMPEEETKPTHLVQLFDAASREAVAVRIAALPGCRVLPSEGDIIPVVLAATAIDDIAGWLEVSWIEAYVAPKLNNNIAVQSPRMNVEAVWPDGSTGLDLTGAGQVVAVADTGFDNGDLSTCHVDVRGRILSAYSINRKTVWNDLNGHGTHVVGSVLGNGTAVPSEKVKGPAYEATLIMQSIASSTGAEGGSISVPSYLYSLFNQAYTNQHGQAGARIHSNSWGAAVEGQYTTSSQYVDQFTFANPDMLIVVSSGNEGLDENKDGVIDLGSVGAPATAKNCLTVGACENERKGKSAWGSSWPTKYTANPIATDPRSYPAGGEGARPGMAAFSSRGPCLDGRIKPDIVAPGTDILSLKSSVGTSSGWGGITYIGVNPQPYLFMGGTSMSTPLTSGAAALARQWLIETRGISNPDGATIKALLLAGAKSLYPGQYGTAQYLEIPFAYPNNVEGWGEVDLARSIEEDTKVWNAKVIAQGETQTFMVNVTEEQSVLAVILAYADAKASTSSSKQLVNDLDLTVISPSGRVYYPNSGSGPDRVNNVEGVRVDMNETGTYELRVSAYSINTAQSTSLTGGKANAMRYSLVANVSPGFRPSLSLAQQDILLPVTGTMKNSPDRTTNVVITANCEWTASASDSWIVLDKTSGDGDARLYLTVSTNLVTSSRTGTVTVVAGGPSAYAVTKTITVMQLGASVDIGFAVPSEWSHGESFFTAPMTDAVGTSPRRSFDEGEPFRAFWGWANFSDDRVTGELVTNRLVITSGSGDEVYRREFGWTISADAHCGGWETLSDDAWTGLAVGTYTITLTLDAYNRLLEDERGNNTAMASLVIQGGELTLKKALGCEDLDFSSPDGGWYAAANEGPDGKHAAHCTSPGDCGETVLSTTVNGPGKLSFKWKSSTEEDYDLFEFRVDGQTIVDISGESGWLERTYDVLEGTHVIEWRYIKDDGSEDGEDSCWVSDVRWEPLKKKSQMIILKYW